MIRDGQGAGDKKLFNNAAQAWNHAFFWNAMTPDAASPPAIWPRRSTAAFGDLAGLKTEVRRGRRRPVRLRLGLAGRRTPTGKLKVVTTHDADDTGRPTAGLIPLLVCDLWEHAYYLDHQNDRKGFLEAWFDALPNWEFAASQFAAARGQGQAWRYPAPRSGRSS